MTAVASVQSQRAAPPTGGQDYVVQRGDTLWDISRRNGVYLDSLIRANPQIANPDLILVGQHINVPGRGGAGGPSGGAVDAGSAVGLPTSGPHANAAAVAEQYLGRNASELRGDRSDDLPMQAGVPANVCCANFVSAVLTEAGQLPANLHTNSVRQLDSTLRSQGWTEVPASQARPGDVVIIQGGGVSHTVLVSGPGQTIGSNNRNADGTQRITHGSLSWALDHGATILRAPAGVAGGDPTERPGAAAPAGGAAPTGTGSVAQRQVEAVRYFESRGWSHAQAAGIVANLTRESQLSPTARGDGGLAYGLAQWHPDRQANFARFAGHPIQNSTFAEQLAFIDHELRTTEAAAGDRLRGATSAGEAGSIVSRYYERPADRAGEASARATLADQIAAQTR